MNPPVEPRHAQPLRAEPFNAEPLNSRLIEALYTEAMLLADEARGYFEDGARSDRLTFDPLTRVSFSCESLKVTTRLMHIVAWLLTRRAIGSGELPRTARDGGDRRLGIAADSDRDVVALFPEAARGLIAASADLYARVQRLEDGGGAGGDGGPGPARALMSRLEQSL